MTHPIYQKYLNLKNDLIYETDAEGVCLKSLGIMALLRMSYDHVDMRPLQNRIEREILNNPRNAAALLDSANLMFFLGANASSSVKFIQGNNVYALKRQQAAFEQTVFFKIRESSSPALRVLALAAPGEISNNTPIEFLLQNDEIDITFWYVLPDVEETSIPEHDIAIVIAGFSDFTKPNTDRIQKILQNWPRPVINRIENIQKFARDQFFSHAKGIPGLYIPETKAILHKDINVLSPPYSYPFIIRPTKSFGGRGLIKIEQPSDLISYLNTRQVPEYFVSPFIDYSSEDGLFRKYRLAVIEGKAFPFHMAVSEKWALWYYSAGMLSDKNKLLEEDRFISNFEKNGLGKRYGGAIGQLFRKIGSEYFVLDCAETKSGELLIFEGGHDMVVHDMDSAELCPSKRKQVHKLFHAFQMMLKSHANAGRLRK